MRNYVKSPRILISVASYLQETLDGEWESYDLWCHAMPKEVGNNIHSHLHLVQKLKRERLVHYLQTICVTSLK